jgi:DUF2927 family protein
MYRAAALLSLALLSGCAAATSSTGNDVTDMIADNFVRLAVSPAKPDEPAAKIQKWATPIRYASVGPASPLTRASLELAMNQLSGLTGLDIAVATEDLPNYLVLFAPSTLEAAVARNRSLTSPFFDDSAQLGSFIGRPHPSDCALHATTHKPDWTIRSALLIVPTGGSPVEAGRCITALTARSMGFLSTVARVDSAMSDGARIDHLTSEDKLMLRVLYDARLKAGTTAKEATPVVRSVLASLREN